MNDSRNIRGTLARSRSKTPRDRKKIMLELISVSFTRAHMYTPHSIQIHVQKPINRSEATYIIMIMILNNIQDTK